VREPVIVELERLLHAPFRGLAEVRRPPLYSG
jgi:hypothetical protein